MRPILLGLIFVSVSLGAFAQLLLKVGMSQPGVRTALAGAPFVQWPLAVASSPLVVIGLGTYGVGSLMWLFVLSKLELSAAYPFVGLGFIATLLVGWLVLGEQLTLARVLGTLLIASGAVLVARTV